MRHHVINGGQHQYYRLPGSDTEVIAPGLQTDKKFSRWLENYYRDERGQWSRLQAFYFDINNYEFLSAYARWSYAFSLLLPVLKIVSEEFNFLSLDNAYTALPRGVRALLPAVFILVLPAFFGLANVLYGVLREMAEECASNLSNRPLPEAEPLRATNQVQFPLPVLSGVAPTLKAPRQYVIYTLLMLILQTAYAIECEYKDSNNNLCLGLDYAYANSSHWMMGVALTVWGQAALGISVDGIISSIAFGGVGLWKSLQWIRQKTQGAYESVRASFQDDFPLYN